jgi:hypothetical protein
LLAALEVGDQHVVADQHFDRLLLLGDMVLVLVRLWLRLARRAVVGRTVRDGFRRGGQRACRRQRR